MSKAKSIFNFSIFSLAGASIGFTISLLFLNNDSKSIIGELSDTAFSYNYAVEKASPAVATSIASKSWINNYQLKGDLIPYSIIKASGKNKSRVRSYLSSDGYILTNQHAFEITRVTIELHDGQIYRSVDWH